MDTRWYTRVYYNNDTESVARGVYLVSKEVQKLRNDVTLMQKKLKNLSTLSQKEEGNSTEGEDVSYENVETFNGCNVLYHPLMNKGKQGFDVILHGADQLSYEDYDILLKEVFPAYILSSNAKLNRTKHMDESDKGFECEVPLKYIGNRVDIALARHEDFDDDIKELSLKYKKVAEIPYTQEKKFNVVIYEKEDCYWVIMRGAMNVILPRCTSFKLPGEEKEMTEEMKTLEQQRIAKREDFSVSLAQAFIQKSQYPDGNIDVTQEDALLKELCYIGTACMGRAKLSNEENPSLKAALSQGKRVVLITGMPFHMADYAVREKLYDSREWWTWHDETIEEMAKRIDWDVESFKDEYRSRAILDGSRLQTITAQDLSEMLFGTHKLMFANTPPLLKVDMVLACIENEVVPVLTSHLTISGTPLESAKSAVHRCRAAGIKVVLLTSLEGDEARAQALALGVFTKNSKTIEDIAARLNVSVEQTWPRKARSRIFTRNEMKEMNVDVIRGNLAKYPEIVFSGLTQCEKDIVEICDCASGMNLFVMC